MLDTLRQIVIELWATVAEMSPYLLFGFFVAGLLSVLISQRVVERHLGGHGLLPLLKASLFGIPLPLCSCGVIPVSMSLRQHGASKGAVISFLLSTPQTGVDSIFVTLSLLGPVFAIFRPLAALVTGLVGGGLVDAFEPPEAAEPKPEPCTDACCAGSKGAGRKFANGMKYAFVTLPRDIGKAMLVGLLIAAVIAAVVPDGFFAERLGTGISAMLVMMVVGIPIYVCATASVPMAAALILKGLTPGAALVFLMTGPATNAAGLATIYKTLGRRVALLYLLAVAGCSLAAGMTLDYLAFNTTLSVAHDHHWMMPPIIKHLSAFVLIGLLAYGILKGKKKH